KHSQYTVDRLETIRRARNQAARTAWIVKIVTVLLLAVLVFALADYRMLLSQTARITGTIVLAGIVLFGLVRLWQFLRKRGDTKEVALELEAQRNELGCVVSTAAEYLAAKRKGDSDCEAKLVEA